MAGNFNIKFNGSAARNVTHYEYSQSNLSHSASQASMNTTSQEIDYGTVENFDYESYLVENTTPQAVEHPQQVVITEEMVEEVRNELRGYGFTDNDIERLLTGKIALEDLYKEIENDPDGSRRRKIYESNYLMSLGSEFNNVDVLKADIEKTKRELQAAREAQGAFDFTEEEAAYGLLMALAMYGGDIDEIADSYIIGWSYEDENGVTRYEYSYNPNYYGGFYGATPIYYNDVYKDSKYLEEIRASLVETTRTRGILWWTEEYTAYEWQGTEEQLALYDRIDAAKEKAIANREAKRAEYQTQIDNLVTRQLQEEAILNYVNQELDHYMENVDGYIHQEDFLNKSGMNAALREKASEINASTETMQYYTETGAMAIRYVGGKEDGMAVISSILNNTGDFSCTGGYIFSGKGFVQVSLTDATLKNYSSWLPYMQEEEKQVFNYIYNTEGSEVAYQYLEKIADELDNRWLMDKQQKDAAWAKEHPVLASISSVFITPFEGINAAFHSLGSVITGNEIRRVEVYSAGDTFRQAVSQDIYEKYGEGWAFLYGTGMSMADSIVLIAGCYATGGLMGAAGVTSATATTTANVVLSATTMGSRAYVSTLNDALDRGLNDGQAVTLAFSSAAVETLMESYSVGHLLNLEGALGNASKNIVTRVTSSISNPALQKIAINSGYFALGVLSQGLCEGEEEFCTEILNHYLDEMISGDLSNYNLAIYNYMLEGKSEEEARRLATEDYHDQIAQAFAGGFLSGGIFGGGKIGFSEYNVSRRVSSAINAEYKVAGLTALEQTQRNQIVASVLGVDSRYQTECINALSGNLTQEQVSSMNIPAMLAINEAVNNYQRYDSNFTLPITLKVTLSSEMASNFDYSNEVMNSSSQESTFEILQQSDFKEILTFLNSLTEDNLPEGYTTISEYETAFIKEFIKSGKINEITNGELFNLINNRPIMLSELIGTDKLNDLFVKNLEKQYSMLIPLLKDLTPEQMNTLFSSGSLITLVNSLSPKTLGKIVQTFDKSFTASWVSIENIVDVIGNMSTEDLTQFINNIGYSKDNMVLALENDLSKNNYSRLLDIITTKFYTKELILTNPDYKSCVEHLIIDSYLIYGKENISDIREKLGNIDALQAEVKETIQNAIVKNSEVELVEKYGRFEIPLEGDYKYYDLTYVLDGVEYTQTESVFGNSLSLNIFLNNPKILTALLEGNLTIKKVSPNIAKSTLVLTEKQGLKSGLNEVILLIDGKEEKLILNLEYDSIDVSRDFQNSKSVVIQSVKPLGTFNIEIPDNQALYKVQYEINGEHFVSYQTVSKKSSFSNVGENVLELDNFIVNKKLFGVKILDVSPVTLQEINTIFPTIDRYSTSESIYTTEKYGGDQSDVRRFTQQFLGGESLSEIDSQKAKILVSLIDKYFPNATDIQKVNLATVYENGGCAYMATANAFATYMGTLQNGEAIFRNLFGYDLVVRDSINSSYNVEGIAFDICLRNLAKKYNNDINAIDFKKFDSDEESVGISAFAFDSIVAEYFREHGIEIEANTTMHSNGYSLESDLVAMALAEKDRFHILSASHFDMELLSGQQLVNSQDGALANSETKGSMAKNVGGHAMLVTGIDEKMNLIVSSWSRQYRFWANSLQNYKTEKTTPHASIWSVKFSIPTEK